MPGETFRVEGWWHSVAPTAHRSGGEQTMDSATSGGGEADGRSGQAETRPVLSAERLEEGP